MIEEEVRMQLLKFMSLLGRRASHLDGHNHVHVVPRVAEVVANVMAEMGVYRYRGLE